MKEYIKDHLNQPLDFSFKDDWKLAAKWLLQCNCLPEHLKSQLAKDTLTLKTFGVELRNGVILCNLLNYLIPNSVNLSKISKHSKQSRVMSAYNVTMFQEACSLFELNEPIQLDPDKLYDLDLSQTLKVLSMLSISPPSIAKGLTLNFNKIFILHNITYLCTLLCRFLDKNVDL